MHPPEQRSFGRRKSTALAWIVVPGRSRVPCRVLDDTAKGAFLEFDTKTWLPLRFDLVLEGRQGRLTCETVRTNPRGVGVVYVASDETSIESSSAAGSGIPDPAEWSGRKIRKPRAHLTARPR